ncbi:hypothetical protein [Bdellovibrio reynosensis]|uniref:Outer membrane protein beta-barrel domain-containing protein n=1 Tax=Bdellovibrio reynosensis TaxID=2835041 RepID=A0ABY4CB80_9BACT|nr:hypothetical protein [Bdellovibrio reynosensis]UOF02226.1 hypothetical protein MNR06_04590 [Bdellovibrio reynosensis]
MRRYFIKFWIFAVLFFPFLSLAQEGGKRFSVALAGGYTNTPFSGIQGSDFSAFNHYAVDVSMRYRTKSMNITLGYAYTPQIKLVDIRWTDGETGDYNLDFMTPYIGIGPISKKFLFDFLVGIESMRLSGTPEVGFNGPSSTLIGFRGGWHGHYKGRLSFPMYARVWLKPVRELQFTEKPSENSEVAAGAGVDLMIGVSYELF